MWRCRPIAPRSKRGLSLIEMMLVLSMSGLFLLAVQEALTVGLRTVHASDERGDIRLQLSNTLERMTREASLASNVDNAEDQRFQFDADLDGDGSAENNINYRVQNGDLERVQGGTTVVLVSDLASLDLDYVEAGATSAASCDNTSSCSTVCCRSEIGTVHITLTATKDSETISLSSAVFLRNNS